MRVLGIEASCDETGVAIYCSEQGLIANQLYSQVNLHQQYGGVVPELASRDHIRKLIPLVKQALKEANITINDIGGIAYTAGPGLIGALMVGASFGRALGFALDIPTIAVNHMEAHLLAPLLEENKPSFPFLALVVSGGHTMLVAVNQIGDYQILGQSIDDAAGEAFDKTAKLLGLDYPGGPRLAKLAENGQPDKFHFPRPMVDRPGLDFSFSGLKTFALNTINNNPKDEQTKADIALAFEEAVVDTLVIKCKRALMETQFNRLVVAGGVGANLKLRNKLHQLAHKLQIELFFPRIEFCTDNGAMTALAGYYRMKAGQHDDLAITVHSRWPLDSLSIVTS